MQIQGARAALCSDNGGSYLYSILNSYSVIIFKAL